MGSAEDIGERERARDSGSTKVKRSQWPIAMGGVDSLPMALHTPVSVGLFSDDTSLGHLEALLMHCQHPDLLRGSISLQD